MLLVVVGAVLPGRWDPAVLTGLKPLAAASAASGLPAALAAAEGAAATVADWLAAAPLAAGSLANSVAGTGLGGADVTGWGA